MSKSQSFRDLKAEYLKNSIAKPDFIQQAHSEFHAKLLSFAADICETDIAAIEIRDNIVTMRTRLDNIVMEVDPYDYRTAPIEALNFDHYEFVESSVVRRLAKSIDTMLDIGANIGWYSLLVALMNNESSVHAFEPIPRTFDRLKRHCHLNGASNITCHNFGLSSSAGSFPFYFYPEGSGNASMRNLADRQDAEVVECQLSTIDIFSSQLPPETRCDFIKCDVEGNELFVLQGGLDFLAHHKPILFLELLRKWSAPFGYHPNDVLSLLRDLGYMVFVSDSEAGLKPFGSVTDSTTETNYFFVHPDSRLRHCLNV